MITRRITLHFPPTKTNTPIIYELCTKYNIIPNIKRAKIEAEEGWMALEVQAADEATLKKALDFLKSQDIGVSTPEGDAVEG